MKPTRLSLLWFGLAVTACVAALPVGAQTQLAVNQAANKSEPIPADQIGAVAGKQYQGDGLSVIATADGARIRCVFQRMEGQVTREGLWLTSMAEDSRGERFRVVAVAVGREGDSSREMAHEPLARSADFQSAVSRIFNPQAARSCRGSDTHRSPAECNSAIQQITNLRYEATDSRRLALPPTGIVEVADKLARFIRPGLTEEYSVSVDGVRQDFIIEKRPICEGQLRVELEVSGAKAEPLVQGARLVLDGSGRKIAYNRLRVVDSEGKELAAQLEVTDETRLAVVVDDTAATYPVRIDPTFSDADWISLSGIPGADTGVIAAVTDDSGNLYIGGDFTIVGDVIANRIAKWNGSVWSALGPGMNGSVRALAVFGTNLYAGGQFTTAGETAANYIAKWNGNAWSAMESGMNYWINALAVSGSDLYVGGLFPTAGGIAANFIAKWDGSAWSALSSGLNSTVHALAVSGMDLYVGGWFTAAGGTAANCIANGTRAYGPPWDRG